MTMPNSTNNYTMLIDNKYIEMYDDAKKLLDNIKSEKMSKEQVEFQLNELQDEAEEISKAAKSMPSKTLTKDIYRYDAGSGKYKTYINGKGYSQYVYLNKSGNYAFTPSSWMVAAGLTVTMPTSANGYRMDIINPYIQKYEDVIKQIRTSSHLYHRDSYMQAQQDVINVTPNTYLKDYYSGNINMNNIFVYFSELQEFRWECYDWGIELWKQRECSIAKDKAKEEKMRLALSKIKDGLADVIMDMDLYGDGGEVDEKKLIADLKACGEIVDTNLKIIKEINFTN